MGDVGFLKNVLLVPQLNKDLISEGQLMRENDWGINSRKLWKRLVDDTGNVLMKGWIIDSSNMYVMNPAYPTVLAWQKIWLKRRNRRTND